MERDKVRFVISLILPIKCFYITQTAGIRLSFDSLPVVSEMFHRQKLPDCLDQQS